jgi:hypothetical protein
MNGKTLQYHRRGDGTFLLYSVGVDGKDDGGDSTMVIRSDNSGQSYARDLVWRQAATGKEIEAFERKQKRK